MKFLVNKIKSNKLIVDSFWSLLGNIVGKGLALVAGIILARFLGKHEYGEYGIIRNTILTIGIFSTLGLGYTSTKFIAEYKLKNPDKIKIFVRYANIITLVFSGLMSVLLFVFSDFIASDVLKIESLTNSLRILSALILFNAITTTQIGILAGFSKFKELAKINSFVGIITFIFSVLLTYYFHIEGALSALLIVQVINCILNQLVVKMEINNENFNYIKEDKGLIKDILRFSMPIALQEFVYSISSWLSNLLLVYFSTVGEVGMFSAAMQWNAIILFIPGILRNVVLSHMSSSIENKKQHNKILNHTIKINVIFTLIPSILILLFSSFIEDFYGKTFSGLAGLISIAVFSTVFTSISNVYSQAFTSLGKNWLMFFLRVFRDFGIILFAYLIMSYSVLNGAYVLIVLNIVFYIFFLIIISFIYNKYYNKNEKYNILAN